MSPADQANQHMVDALIAEGALWSASLIAAFRATPRHLFLDRVFQFQSRQNRWKEIITRDPGPEELRIVYSDQALITRLGVAGRDRRLAPISSSSQPSLMAQMLEDLKLRPGLKVLEIGAGTGYNAALMAHVVGPDRVVSIDVDRHVLSEAWDHLRRLPERRVCVKHADGRLGYPESAPHDRIVVTAATPDLEPAWLEQLGEGGLLSAPLALAPGVSYIVCGTARQGIFEGRLLRPAYFMALRSEGGTGEDDAEEDAGLDDRLRRVPAPWADLFERRRPRVTWGRFIHSLTFFGWLGGLTILARRGPDQQQVHGFQRADGACCWVSSEEWFVADAADHAIGQELWRSFLDAGGPWPTEFRLRADPGGGLEPTGRPHEYIHQGPRCQQVWELMEPRDRPGWL